MENPKAKIKFDEIELHNIYFNESVGNMFLFSVYFICIPFSFSSLNNADLDVMILLSIIYTFSYFAIFLLHVGGRRSPYLVEERGRNTC